MKLKLLMDNNEFKEFGFNDDALQNSADEIINFLKTAKSEKKIIHLGVKGNLNSSIDAAKIRGIHIEVEL